MPDRRVCIGLDDQGEPCRNAVPDRSQSDRCPGCRDRHHKAKQADYQWAYRLRQREKARAAAASRGHPCPPTRPDGATSRRPGRRTAATLPDGDPDRLKEVAAQLAALQKAVARAQAALDAAVRSRR